jgi:HK97 gp10 family phage protein
MALLGLPVGLPDMAAPMLQVRVDGLNKLTRALRKAGVAVQDMKAANAAVGEVVARSARPITPHATGALADSIRPAQRQSGVIVRAGGGRVRYARYVEYGTSRMQARSYLIKGAHDSQPRWLDVYADELQKLMDKVAGEADGTGD